MPEEHIDEYVALKNEALVDKACAGDTSASGELVKRLSVDVEFMAYALSEYGIEKADLFQDGMIGLLGAISTYKSEFDASFRTYAKACISNSMITELRKLSQKKQIPKDKIISIDSRISNQTVLSPEENLLEKERLNNLQKRIRNALSDYEYQVFNMYIHGYSYKEIGQSVSKSAKSVANALCRIKHKLKTIDKG